MHHLPIVPMVQLALILLPFVRPAVARPDGYHSRNDEAITCFGPLPVQGTDRPQSYNANIHIDGGYPPLTGLCGIHSRSYTQTAGLYCDFETRDLVSSSEGLHSTVQDVPYEYCRKRCLCRSDLDNLRRFSSHTHTDLVQLENWWWDYGITPKHRRLIENMRNFLRAVDANDPSSTEQHDALLDDLISQSYSMQGFPRKQPKGRRRLRRSDSSSQEDFLFADESLDDDPAYTPPTLENPGKLESPDSLDNLDIGLYKDWSLFADIEISCVGPVPEIFSIFAGQSLKQLCRYLVVCDPVSHTLKGAPNVDLEDVAENLAPYCLANCVCEKSMLTFLAAMRKNGGKSEGGFKEYLQENGLQTEHWARNRNAKRKRRARESCDSGSYRTSRSCRADQFRIDEGKRPTGGYSSRALGLSQHVLSG